MVKSASRVNMVEACKMGTKALSFRRERCRKVRGYLLLV
jgi:hypothetical protein